MDQDPSILLIDEDSAAIDSIRRILGDQASRFKLRHVADVPTALARIRGGGIDVVLLNLASGGAENPLAPLHALQEKAQGVAVVILRFRRRRSSPDRGPTRGGGLSPPRSL